MSPTETIRKVTHTTKDLKVCVSYAECKTCNKGARFGVLTKIGFVCDKCHASGTENTGK